jgi:hypothetical protein
MCCGIYYVIQGSRISIWESTAGRIQSRARLLERFTKANTNIQAEVHISYVTQYIPIFGDDIKSSPLAIIVLVQRVIIIEVFQLKPISPVTLLTSLTELEKHDHLMLKHNIVSISNTILHKYGTKHAPRTISNSNDLRGLAIEAISCARERGREVTMIVNRIKKNLLDNAEAF